MQYLRGRKLDKTPPVSLRSTAPSGMGPLAKPQTFPHCQRLPPRGSWQNRQVLTEGVRSKPTRENSVWSGPQSLSGQRPSICLRRPLCRLKAPLGLSLLRKRGRSKREIKNNPTAENIQSISGGYSKSFFLRKRAGGSAVVVTFDDSTKKSPEKLDGNSKMNPTQNRKTVI